MQIKSSSQHKSKKRSYYYLLYGSVVWQIAVIVFFICISIWGDDFLPNHPLRLHLSDESNYSSMLYVLLIIGSTVCAHANIKLFWKPKNPTHRLLAYLSNTSIIFALSYFTFFITLMLCWSLT